MIFQSGNLPAVGTGALPPQITRNWLYQKACKIRGLFALPFRKQKAPFFQVYLKSRKFSLFLQAQLDFALNSLEIHKGFLRLFALNPACACEPFVIFFVFRYTLRSQLPRGGSFWGRPAKFPSCAKPLPFGRGGIASAMTERVLSSRPDHPDTLRRAERYAPCGLPDCRPAGYRTPVRSAPHRWALL